MNRLLIAAVLFVVVVARGANPAFQDFNANQFSTSGNKVAVKGGVLLTNPVINSGSITGNGNGLTNIANVPTLNAGSNHFTGDAGWDGQIGVAAVTSGTLSISGTIHGVYTNTYGYWDANGFFRGTNDGSGWTNIGAGSVAGVYASNLISGGTIPVGTLFTATTQANVGGFLLETVGSVRFRTYNAASLTGIVASAIYSGILSNVVTIPSVVALAASGTNITVNASLGNHFSLTCATNIYFVQPTSLSPLQELLIDVRMNGTGGWSVNFDTNYWKFPSGQVLTTTTNANAWSVISAVVGQFATNVAVIQSLNFQ